MNRRQKYPLEAAQRQAARLSTASGKPWYVVRTASGHVMAVARPRHTDTVLETHESAAVPA